MSDALQLLRMLEPPVRPVSASSPARPVGDDAAPPHGFDAWLTVAAGPDAATLRQPPDAALEMSDDAGTPVAATPTPADPLAALGDVRHIENATLLARLAQDRPDRAAVDTPTLPG